MEPNLRSCPWVRRYAQNPVLSAADVPYPSTLVFNAGVIFHQGRYVMVFRNDYGYESEKGFAGTNIGIAESEDGIHWKVRPEPCFDSRDPRLSGFFGLPEGEMIRVYDPRLTVIGDEVYMTFAADTRHGLRGGIARTDDFRQFRVLSLSVPDNRNMVLFPEKVQGMYLRLERPMPVYSRGRDRFDLWLSESPDLVHWGGSVLLSGVEDFPYANDKIGPGAPPVRTDRGWLVLTHGVDLDRNRGKNGWETSWKKRYCAGMMLLDLEDPRKVLGIYREPLLAPDAAYETEGGFRNHVVFPTAAVPGTDGQLKIYYGSADTVVALAYAPVEKLVDLCLAGGGPGHAGL